jgi:hypothetical protein
MWWMQGAPVAQDQGLMRRFLRVGGPRAHELQLATHPPLQPLQPQPLTTGMVGLLPNRILRGWNPLYPGVWLRATRSGKGGVDETT